MLVHVLKRLEQPSCPCQWKNLKQLPVFMEGATQPMRSLCLSCKKEWNSGTIVGHLPRKIAKECAHCFCEEEVQFAVQFTVLSVRCHKMFIVDKYSCV